MTKIKVLATDIDGTLINSEHKISTENRALIEKIKSMGKHVIVSTGRSHIESIYMFNNEGIACAKICANGGVVVDEEGKVVATSPANRKSIKKCIETLLSLPVYFEVYTNKSCISPNYLNSAEKKLILSGHVVAGYQKSVDTFVEAIHSRVARGTLKLVDSFEDTLDDDSIEFYKIIVVSVNKDILCELRKQFVQDNELCITSSGSNNIEINGKNASKGNALRRYADIYGYDISEIMAIGDSYNDVSMFEAAGVSVAMGNAPDDVKEICDWVTGTNDETGWADAATKFMMP